jgi:hypothetical protein
MFEHGGVEPPTNSFQGCCSAAELAFIRFASALHVNGGRYHELTVTARSAAELPRHDLEAGLGFEPRSCVLLVDGRDDDVRTLSSSVANVCVYACQRCLYQLGYPDLRSSD